MSPFAGMRFVACCRVSLDKRDRSNLDFEAKPEVAARHVAGQGGAVATAFEEVENGRRGDLPQLALAMAGCRLQRCMLVIAKLDRLARGARSAAATRRAAEVLPYLNAARGAGATTLQHPADTLTACACRAAARSGGHGRSGACSIEPQRRLWMPS